MRDDGQCMAIRRRYEFCILLLHYGAVSHTILAFESTMKMLSAIFTLILLSVPRTVLATQAHGAPEGIYAHQLAHLFFMFSMVIFIYWLRQRKLVVNPGWRYIQYAAFFLILWNFNVLVVHFLDEQVMMVTVEKINDWQIQVRSPIGWWLELVYYIAKMDHLLCVPALVLLLFGLKKLAADAFPHSKEWRS